MTTLERKTAQAISLCLAGHRQSVAYLSPNETIKVTRQRRPGKRARATTLLVTIGHPAYLERRFIKACLKAGDKFPVRKIQVKGYRKSDAPC